MSKKSLVPTMNDFMRPILEYAAEKNGDFDRSDAAEAMAKHFNLSPTAKKERTREDNKPCYQDRTSWSICPHLHEAGLLHRTRSARSGYYEITDLGWEELASSNERITTTYLYNKYPAYRKWRDSKRQKNKRRRT